MTESSSDTAGRVELAACPFCGQPGEEWINGTPEHGEYRVGCTNGDCFLSDSWELKVGNLPFQRLLWNTRRTPPPSAQGAGDGFDEWWALQNNYVPKTELGKDALRALYSTAKKAWDAGRAAPPLPTPPCISCGKMESQHLTGGFCYPECDTRATKYAPMPRPLPTLPAGAEDWRVEIFKLLEAWLRDGDEALYGDVHYDGCWREHPLCALDIVRPRPAPLPEEIHKELEVLRAGPLRKSPGPPDLKEWDDWEQAVYAAGQRLAAHLEEAAKEREGWKSAYERLLRAVNRVTANHRHGRKVTAEMLDKLSNRQVDVEADVPRPALATTTPATPEKEKNDMNEQELKSKASAVRKAWDEWLAGDEGFPTQAFLNSISSLVDSIIGPEPEEGATPKTGGTE